MIRIALLFILLFTLPTSSWAMRLSVVAAGIHSQPEVSPSTFSYTPNTEYGGGALLEFGIVPFVGLELGALYLPRSFQYTPLYYTNITVTLKTIQYPVLLRAYLFDMLSIGAGGYYAKYISGVKYETSTPAGIQNTSNTLALSNLEESDYGLVGSVAIYIPFSKLSRLMLDGRYTVGLKDNSLATNEIKYNDIQVLAGLQVGF